MTHRITVHEVLEYNDCAGKKFIEVTDAEHSQMVPTRFRLTGSYMFPAEKLLLSTVSPTDEVMVTVDEFPASPLLIGEFYANLSASTDRIPLCRCGTPTVSDGFSIFCPNSFCGLTLLRRIERLGETKFFNPENFITDLDKLEFLALKESPYYETPFTPILQPKLWSNIDSNLYTVMLSRVAQGVTLATFLVEDLFREFLDRVSSPMAYNAILFTGMTSFYAHLTETVHRRNYKSVLQNKLLANFIWCLGIESLRKDVIEKMLYYEINMGTAGEVLLPYVYFLTHPDEMVRELGIHRLEATTICGEVYKRRFELMDIFSAYADPDMVRYIFGDST